MGGLDLKVPLDDVELNVFTKLRDGNEVAHLLPVCYPPLSLPDDDGICHMIPTLSRPALANLLTWMKEMSHGRANGSNSTMMAHCHHCWIRIVRSIFDFSV